MSGSGADTESGDEDPAGDGDGDSSGDGDGDAPGDGDGDSSGDGDGDGPGDGDGDLPDPDPFEPFAEGDWARGDIRVDRVEVNQAVAIEVVADGELIPVEARTGGLVKDRNALIQAFWSIPGNWQPRPILAKLHVRDGQGQLAVYEETKQISGAPSSGSISGPITWSLPAESFEGNLEFFIELWEGEPGHEGLPASSSAPSAPAGGMQAIGVTSEPMEAKIVLVPVQYEVNGCNTDSTNVINNNYDAFYDWFFVQNPVESLTMSVREQPLVQEVPLQALSQINNRLVGLRFEDFAEPNVYYHAVVDACAGGVDGAGGLAPGTPGPIKGAGDLRVSTTLWVNLNFTRNAFVHELGHNQGRPHAPCGDVDGADMNYPHENAKIGAWGFNINNFQWYNPNTFVDYMSYCNPTWVSDYNWGLNHEQVRQLSSWDYEGPGADDEGLFVEVLHGTVHPGGYEAWWTSPGELPPDQLSSTDSISFYAQQGELIETRPAASWLLEDGKTRYFMAEVPDDALELVDDIVRVSHDVPTRVPREQVIRYFDR